MGENFVYFVLLCFIPQGLGGGGSFGVSILQSQTQSYHMIQQLNS